MLNGIDFRLKQKLSILPEGTSITSTCLVNLAGTEQLMITTSSLDVFILKMPELGHTTTFKLSSPATVCFAPSSLTNTLFFGLTVVGGFGAASANIQVMMPGKEIMEVNAH